MLSERTKLNRLILCALACLFSSILAFPSHAAAPDAGSLNREIEKALPTIGKNTPPHAGSAEIGKFPPQNAEERKRYIEDPAQNIPEEEDLAAPIKEITLSTPLLQKEIGDLLHQHLFNRNQIGTKQLGELKQMIGSLGIEHKRILHVVFRLFPGTAEEGVSRLRVEVSEILVRHVFAQEKVPGSVRANVLDEIREAAWAGFHENKILDLDALDTFIKKRLRYGDIELHATIEPLDETHVDLKIIVNRPPVTGPSLLVQYDNAGSWAFGRDRLLGGLSYNSFGFSGDRLDLLGMKSMDIGNRDDAHGTYFMRTEYTAPFGDWGFQTITWASALRYQEVNNNPSKTQANGEAFEVGQGIAHPFYLSDQATLTARADFFEKYAVDRILDTVRIGEKYSHNGRLKIDYAKKLDEKTALQINTAFTTGSIDLSGNKTAYTQDQSGPYVTGLFTKIELSAILQGLLSTDNQIDYRLNTKGQMAGNNLDSMEKFSLGGPSGLRAFGLSEASADAGYILNAEIGHSFWSGFRAYTFYDMGEIWKSIRPWSGEGGPLNYVLQDVGLGLTQSFDAIEASLTFAHQVGPNPGLSSTGKDSDNTQQRYRVWSSLAYRY